MPIQPILPKGPLYDEGRFRSSLETAVRNVVVEGVRFMAAYPAQHAGARYRRTGTLGRSWSSEVTVRSDAIEGVTGSNSGAAPYNRQVEGSDAEQDARFRNWGWQNSSDLASHFAFVAPGLLDAAVKAALG